MTPYTQEVEEALKWADTFGEWEGVDGIPDRHCAVLASELRRQSQEFEIMNARVTVDAKSYERDQYLIAALRKQLAQEKP